MARPMPELAPVTAAILPASDLDIRAASLFCVAFTEYAADAGELQRVFRRIFSLRRNYAK
jgi:hypothetical protein